MPGGMALNPLWVHNIYENTVYFSMTTDVRPTRSVEHQSWRNILKELKWTRMDCDFCDQTSAGTGETKRGLG